MDQDAHNISRIYDGDGCWREVIVCLDGGGIRGYSSLLILQALMEHVKTREEIYDARQNRPRGTPTLPFPAEESVLLPCQYFDYAVGTSTGGLIAIMIGRLRMRVADGLKEYRTLGRKIFGKKRPLKWNQYSHKKLEKVILGVIERRCPDSSGKLSHQILFEQPNHNSRECRTAVLACRMNQPHVDEVHMFRSYPYGGTFKDSLSAGRALNPGYNPPVFIREVARATSAAPHYFREALVCGCRYIDGGIMANNPSHKAFYEAKNNHQARPDGQRNEDGHEVGVLVSIGTGNSKQHSMFRRGNIVHHIHAIGRRALKALTDPELVHDLMSDHADELGIPYFRFNVEDGLQDMKMDEWREDTIAKIEAATSQYLAQRKTELELKRCAEYLVAHRRGRFPNDFERRARQQGHVPATPSAPELPNGLLLSHSRSVGTNNSHRFHQSQCSGHSTNQSSSRSDYNPPASPQASPHGFAPFSELPAQQLDYHEAPGHALAPRYSD